MPLAQDVTRTRSTPELREELASLRARHAELLASPRTAGVDAWARARPREDVALDDRAQLIAAIDWLRARIAGLEQNAALAAAREHAHADPRSAPITESMQLLADTMPQLIWITQPDGYHKYYNRHWWEYTGLTYDEAKGTGWNILLHEEDRPRSVERWASSLETGEVYEVEYRFRRASDGAYRWYLGRALPRRDANGEIIEWFGTCTDIDDQKRAEHQLRLANEESARASAAKDQFLATLSHELRTPLNAMLGWVQLIKMEGTTADKRQRGLDAIERNAKAQAQLIEDMLDVSRIINDKLRLECASVRVADIVEAAVVAAAPTAAKKGLELVHDPIDATIWLDADAGRIQQITSNLLSNAIKFTPSGGRVTLRLVRDGSRAVLEVEDTGQGISSAFLPHVFERFRQADSTHARHHGGLGLGLAIVKRLVELHGGTITAHSEGEGRGASFRVSLPVLAVRPAADAAPAPEADTTVADLQGTRCLVIDDDTGAREVVAATLQSYGGVVTTASSVDEGLACLRAAHHDVIISDIAMPGATGHDLIRTLRQLPGGEDATTAAIALTAFASVQDRAEALEAGFDAHVAKPVEPAELVAAIVRLLRSRGTEPRLP